MVPQTTDSTIKLVILILGLLALMALGGAIGLLAAGIAVPGELYAAGAGSSGAVAGILASTRGTAAAVAPTSPPPDAASR